MSRIADRGYAKTLTPPPNESPGAETMHEMSLVQDLLLQIEDLMRQKQAQQVISLRIGVGAFSGVEPDLFRSAYELLAPKSALKGAELKLEEIPLEARCDDCLQEFAVERFRFQCTACQGRRLTILRGEDLILESVTLEQTEQETVP